MENYEKLNRAETRLERNLQNIFWGFITFTGFHTGFIAACGYVISTKEIPTFVVGGIIILVGSILHITSLMTMNSYKLKLNLNESVISKLEEELNDPQQKLEIDSKKPFFSGAHKARKIILWSFWIAELIMGGFYLFK